MTFNLSDIVRMTFKKVTYKTTNELNYMVI